MINKKNNKKNPKVNPYWLYGGVIFLFILFQTFSGGLASNEVNKISQKKFFEYVSMGDVEKIDIVNKREVKVYLTDEASSQEIHKGTVNPYFSLSGRSANYKFEFGDLQNFENSLKKKEDENNLTIDINYVTEQNIWGDLLLSMLPFVIIIGIWIFIMRKMSAGGSGGGGQIFNIGKSKAKLFDEKTDVKTSFKDVAGLEGAKEEVQEIVDFLKNPTKYTSLGGKIPKGALLVGAPGTGKTLLAKAVAGEAKVPFFSLSGSDFVEMFVGVGASRVRDLFKQAKEKSPAIIFIDEIDAIGTARGKSNMTGSNDERENTLNQLLTEMDGFGTNTNVIVIAATNRADVLDKALMRAGRFDRQIFVDLPDVRERKAIFKVHLRPLKKAANLDVDFLSKQTPGFSGADIANVCNEAALIAARKNKKSVGKQDFLDAVDRIVGGLEKKNKIITPDEKKAVAYHEAGHATVSWMLEHAAPLVKVTIVPRGQSLGAAWYLPLGIAATELWQDQLSLKKSLASSQQELAKIKALSLEYQNLGGPTRADQQRFIEPKVAMEWLMNSSKQQGLETKGSITEIVQQGQSLATAQLKVSFKQAHFNRLIQWLQQQNMTNLTLVVSELKAAGPGKVDGFLRFEIR